MTTVTNYRRAASTVPRAPSTLGRRSITRRATAIVVGAGLFAGGMLGATGTPGAAAETGTHPFPVAGGAVQLRYPEGTSATLDGSNGLRKMWVDPVRRLLIASHGHVTAPRGGDVWLVHLDTMQQKGYFPTSKGSSTAQGIEYDGSNPLSRSQLYVPELGTLLYAPYFQMYWQFGNTCANQADLLATMQKCLRQRGQIHLFDVDEPTVGTRMRNLNATGAVIQGAIHGLAYDGDEHILYVAEAPPVATPRGEGLTRVPQIPVGGVRVHAFRNDSHPLQRLDTLEHLWTRQIGGCASLKTNLGEDTSHSFGVTDGVPYALCAPTEFTNLETNQGDSVLPVPTARVGEAGIAQLFVIDPQDRDDITKATIVFHPVPGNITKSAAFLDQASDRLVLSISGTARTQSFIFDAQRGAWIGAPLLTPGHRESYAQADPVTKRLYILESGDRVSSFGEQGPGSGIRIVDTAAIPIDRKEEVYRYENSEGQRIGIASSISAFDPVTRRLFIGTGGGLIRVFQDRTPPLVPPPPEDPDADTNDIEEAEATTVERIGGATGYGARLHLGGGVRGGLQEYFLDHPEWERDTEGDLSGRRPAGGDRGHFFGRVEQLGFNGGRDHGESEARAVGMAFPTQEDGGYDDPTEPELREGWDEVTGQVIEPFAGARPDAEACDPDVPSQDCLAYDALADRIGERFAATCRARGFDDDKPSDRQDGAAVACSEDGAEARAASSEAMTDLPLRIAYASSHATSRYDPEWGVVTTVESVARGVELDVPGRGSLKITEVRQTAEVWANGRPDGPGPDGKGAGSHHEWSANGVRIADDRGHTVWACGTEGPDDPAGLCDSVALVDAINRAFQTRVYARGPRVDDDATVVGSPGGARAMIRKHPVARENDTAVHGDLSWEAAGLELMIVNDSDEVSRVVVQLAGVYAETQYRIGQPAVPIEPLGPASLVVELLDDAGNALAGGMFEVRSVAGSSDLLAPDLGDDPAPNGDEADGEDGNGEDGNGEEGNGEEGNGEGSQAASVDDGLGGVLGLDDALIDGGVCVTADDGVGECRFEDLEPGTYLVTQTAAPEGYFRADSFEVPVFAGFVAEVTFVNPRAIGGIEISLTDDSDPPVPLEGGEFALLAGGSVELARCRTAADGTCGFADVPLAAYVVRQTAAPGEYLPVDDIVFSLDQPGQVAVLRIVNGLEGIAAASTPAFTPPAADQVTFRPGPSAPQPIVRHTPAAPPSQPSGLGRVLSVPGDVLGFLARRPGEALLIAGVWLLFATPAYLAARRRSLTIAKGVA